MSEYTPTTNDIQNGYIQRGGKPEEFDRWLNAYDDDVYHLGYDLGFEMGYAAGYDNGWTAAYEEGWESGYEAAPERKNNDDI